MKNTKLYEVMIEQIKDLIKTDNLKSGDKLPSERELAERFEVSRTSVREALKALNMIGLIESKHGEGNFVKSKFENSLLEPLSVLFLLIGSKYEDILQLRQIIEPQVAYLAAKNITKFQLVELMTIMERINNSSEAEVCAKLDKKFHYKIAEASGNQLISTIMFSISSLIEKYIDSSNIYNINKKMIEIQHQEIYMNLKHHNSEKASECVKKHLELINFK